jgi:hypothetical protein
MNMKKLGIVLGIIILVILIILIVAPLAFKPQITRMIREKANESVTARIDFGDIGFSLLSSFPNARVSVNKITIVNKEPFEGDTLASINSFEIVINPWHYITGRRIDILSLELDQPNLYLLTLKDGRSNYQIIPRTLKKGPERLEEQPTPMNLDIKHYAISDGRIFYANDSSGIYAEMVGLNHNGNGDFAKSVFTLSTKTRIDTLSARLGGVTYLNKASLDIKADLDVDMNANRYTFKQNEIKLNQLALTFNGWVQTAGENINMDLTFETPTTEFKSLLSMVPVIYRRNISGLKAEGQFSVQGKVQGTYNKSQLPLIDARLLVDNGMFEYPELKTPVQNVSIDLQIQNPGKTPDDTEIDLRKFHMEILNEPVDAQLLVKTPISNPYIDGYLKGDVNLANVGKLVPMNDSVQIEGRVHSDVSFRGNLSSLQNKQVGQFKATGSINFSDIKYSAPTMPEPVQVSTANLTFTTTQARLEKFNMQMGKSDLHATGSLDNFFGYAIGRQTLLGALTVSSNYLDLTPFMKSEGGALQPVELPARVEFRMTGNFAEILLDNMDMTNVKGKLLLKDQMLTITDLSADFLNGTMISNGVYTYIKPEPPHIDFKLKLSQLSIPDMFRTFVTVQRLTPMAEYMKGQVSGNLNFNTDLGDSLMPVWQTIASQGALLIPKVQFQDFAPLNKVADALKLSELRDPAVNNLDPTYEIKDGFFHLKPVTFKVGSYEIIASGSNGLDKSLDYKLKIPIPASQIQSGVNTALSSIIGKNVNLQGNETVIMDVGITGFINNPQIQTSLGEIAKGATQQLQQQAKQQLEQEAQKKLQEERSAVQDSINKAVETQKQKQTEDLKKKIRGLFGK